MKLMPQRNNRYKTYHPKHTTRPYCQPGHHQQRGRHFEALMQRLIEHCNEPRLEGLRVGVHYNARSDAALTLRNGALFADGVQVGSTAALCASDDTSCSGYSAGASASYTTYNLGSSLIVEPGMPRVLEVRADIYDSDGTNDVTAD